MSRNPRRQQGLTLVELVVVLTLVGLVASIGATLVGRVAAGQQDSRGRLTLALAADGAVARVADDLQAALPNSLRLTTRDRETWIEWVPVLDAGRYRAASDTVAATPGDPLDTRDAADSSFDVIGTPLGALPSGSQLVFHNLGQAEADAYVGHNRRDGVVLAGGGRQVSFKPAGALGDSTGTQRFFVVGTPITLACQAVAGGFELRRHSGYGWLPAQPDSAGALKGATSTLLLGNLAGCSAAYSTALANIGLLNLRLRLADPQSSAHLDFLHQVAVDNTP
jgi:MSHA biogenesis protein MshO